MINVWNLVYDGGVLEIKMLEIGKNMIDVCKF